MPHLRSVWSAIGLCALIYSRFLPAAHANETDRQFQALNPELQGYMLAASVASSGKTCQRPSKPFRMGADKRGTAVWSIACADGKAYAVSIYSDAQGSTKVLDCAVLKVVAKQECFKPFAPTK